MNLSTLLQPIYLKLKENVINNSAKVLHIDETPFSYMIRKLVGMTKKMIRHHL